MYGRFCTYFPWSNLKVTLEKEFLKLSNRQKKVDKSPEEVQKALIALGCVSKPVSETTRVITESLLDYHDAATTSSVDTTKYTIPAKPPESSPEQPEQERSWASICSSDDDEEAIYSTESPTGEEDMLARTREIQNQLNEFVRRAKASQSMLPSTHGSLEPVEPVTATDSKYVKPEVKVQIEPTPTPKIMMQDALDTLLKQAKESNSEMADSVPVAATSPSISAHTDDISSDVLTKTEQCLSSIVEQIKSQLSQVDVSLFQSSVLSHTPPPLPLSLDSELTDFKRRWGITDENNALSKILEIREITATTTPEAAAGGAGTSPISVPDDTRQKTYASDSDSEIDFTQESSVSAAGGSELLHRSTPDTTLLKKHPSDSDSEIDFTQESSVSAAGEMSIISQVTPPLAIPEAITNPVSLLTEEAPLREPEEQPDDIDQANPDKIPKPSKKKKKSKKKQTKSETVATSPPTLAAPQHDEEVDKQSETSVTLPEPGGTQASEVTEPVISMSAVSEAGTGQSRISESTLSETTRTSVDTPPATEAVKAPEKTGKKKKPKKKQPGSVPLAAAAGGSGGPEIDECNETILTGYYKDYAKKKLEDMGKAKFKEDVFNSIWKITLDLDRIACLDPEMRDKFVTETDSTSAGLSDLRVCLLNIIREQHDIAKVEDFISKVFQKLTVQAIKYVTDTKVGLVSPIVEFLNQWIKGLSSILTIELVPATKIWIKYIVSMYESHTMPIELLEKLHSLCDSFKNRVEFDKKSKVEIENIARLASVISSLLKEHSELSQYYLNSVYLLRMLTHKNYYSIIIKSIDLNTVSTRWLPLIQLRFRELAVMRDAVRLNHLTATSAVSEIISLMNQMEHIYRGHAFIYPVMASMTKDNPLDSDLTHVSKCFNDFVVSSFLKTRSEDVMLDIVHFCKIVESSIIPPEYKSNLVIALRICQSSLTAPDTLAIIDQCLESWKDSD